MANANENILKNYTIQEFANEFGRSVSEGTCKGSDGQPFKAVKFGTTLVYWGEKCGTSSFADVKNHMSDFQIVKHKSEFAKSGYAYKLCKAGNGGMDVTATFEL